MVALTQVPTTDALNDRRQARRRQQTEAWRRRSRLIHRLRRILPLCIAGILIVLTAWVLIRGLVGGFDEGRGGGAAIHMTNARFSGRDGDGRAYVLAAADASRQTGQGGVVSLIKPALIFNAEGLKPVQIVADRGVYHLDSRLLSLEGHVVASDGAGDTFFTSQAAIDTQHLVVNGWNHVQGVGPTGTVTADSFGIYDHGQHIVFAGDVHSILKRD